MEINWSETDPREIEKLFSPYRYIPVKDKQAHIDNHVDAATQETKRARESIPCELDVPYGPSSAERFDIYGTDLDEEKVPVYFWVHGGAWLTGDKDWSGFFIRNVYSWGFKSIVVGYPLCPETKVPEMAGMIQKAVIKAMRLFPKAKFVLAGHSAGAHLVANILCGNNQVSQNEELVRRIVGFVFVSGLFDIRPIQRTIINEALDLTMEEATALSPLLHTGNIRSEWRKKRIPLQLLVAVGRHDPPEFIKQSAKFCEALITQGFNDTTFWVSEEDDHYTIVESMSRTSRTSQTLERFLVKLIPSSSDRRLSRAFYCNRNDNNCHLNRYVSGFLSKPGKL